jgi:hypothetical protein
MLIHFLIVVAIKNVFDLTQPLGQTVHDTVALFVPVGVSTKKLSEEGCLFSARRMTIENTHLSVRLVV